MSAGKAEAEFGKWKSGTGVTPEGLRMTGDPRRPTQLGRRAGWATVLALAAILPHASRVVSADDFPRPVSSPLKTPFRIVAKGKALDATLADLRERTGLRIWLDRRVDPSLPLSRESYGPTAGEILEQLADEHQLELAIADEAALLGPAPAPERGATEMMAAWDRLLAANPGLPNRSAGSLTARHTIRWPRLTTPDEALQIVAESWGLRIDGVSLPHDLWPAADLGAVRVTTALGLIGIGFDLALELDPATRQVTAKPLQPPARVVREYPGQTLPPPLRSQLTSPAVGGQLRRQGDRWLLSGPAKSHALLESRLASASSSPGPDAGGPKTGASNMRAEHDPRSRPASDQKRYSLRLVNKPAEEFLQSLCRSVGWQLEIAPEAAEPLAQRIDLEVEQATLDELVERAVEPLGLRAERDGERLRISKPSAATP